MSLVCLVYHDVLDGAESGRPGPVAARYKLDRPRFETHLEAIARCGAPLLIGSVVDGATLLTFDDGGLSAHRVVAPLLESYGWRGHFFVITSAIGAPGFLDAGALRDLHERGHVVGSHTHTHRDLTALGDDELRREWETSARTLAEILGRRVEAASIPYGFYDERVARAGAAAGYRRIFTSEPWTAARAVAGTTVYGRFGVVSSSTAEHVAALCRASRVAVGRDAAAWYVRKAAKRALGDAYFRARRAVLSRNARAARGRE
jgi:peptidoglycan/xylan/chitin deacetylase (PgdA/CDA1 family)